MKNMNRNITIGIIAAIILVTGGYLVLHNPPAKKPTANTASNSSANSQDMDMPSRNSSDDQATATDKVNITDSSFSPASITVKKGTKVTWTNNDSTSHTVTGDPSNGPSSDTLKPGDSYGYTFTEAGTFSYHCNFHSNMHGTVIVE